MAAIITIFMDLKHLMIAAIVANAAKSGRAPDARQNCHPSHVQPIQDVRPSVRIFAPEQRSFGEKSLEP